MAGFFETGGKVLNTVGQSTDLINDTLSAGRVYTKNLKTEAKKGIERDHIKSDLKHDVEVLRLEGIKEQVTKAIADGNFDLVEDLMEDL